MCEVVDHKSRTCAPCRMKICHDLVVSLSRLFAPGPDGLAMVHSFELMAAWACLMWHLKAVGVLSCSVASCWSSSS